MIADIESVLRTGEMVVAEVPDRKGRWFLLRILPYQKEDEIAGVVLTLIGISVLKERRVSILRRGRSLPRSAADSRK